MKLIVWFNVNTLMLTVAFCLYTVNTNPIVVFQTMFLFYNYFFFVNARFCSAKTIIYTQGGLVIQFDPGELESWSPKH